MSEYLRTNTHSGGVYQWCDQELCIILDKVTGEFIRFEGNNSICTLADALEYLKLYRKGWEDRTVIVKLDCIAAFKMNRSKTND